MPKIPNKQILYFLLQLMHKSQEFLRIEALMKAQEQNMISQFAQQSEQRNSTSVVCSLCQDEYTFNTISDHEAVCPWRLRTCRSCNKEFPQTLMPLHDEQCGRPKQPIFGGVPRQPPRPSRDQATELLQRFGAEVTNVFQGVGRIGRNISSSVNRFGDEVNRFGTQMVVRLQGDSDSSIPTFERIHRRIMQGTSSTTHQEKDENFKSDNVTFQFRPSSQLSPSAKLCLICRSDFDTDETLKMLKCTHRFHEDCINAWLVRSKLCPLCKTNVCDE